MMTGGPLPAVVQGHCSSAEYMRQLARFLLDEAACSGMTGPGISALQSLWPNSSYEELLRGYRQARVEVVRALDAHFEVATAYHSMDEFWADSARQEVGDSLNAYWDSYENGRRRYLEQRLANAFGTPEAVLLNTGMSAIDVALRSLRLPEGASILLHEKAYFETTDLIENVLGRSVAATVVDMRDEKATARALAACKPTVVIVETALNGPRCDVPVLEPLLASGVPLIIDNSAIGHSLSWPDLTEVATGDTIVVESATKYLTRSASAGVLYGTGSWIAEARLCARRVGQQLQGRALHHLRAGEIQLCRQRALLQGHRARQFERQLRECLPGAVVTSAASGAAGRGDSLARLIAGSRGCMVFVRLGDQRTAERRHRTCVARWSAECSAAPRVRAGFGWTETSGRSYGADPLNTKSGESFIRISVGCEPESEIERIAGVFCKHATEAMK